MTAKAARATVRDLIASYGIRDFSSGGSLMVWCLLHSGHVMLMAPIDAIEAADNSLAEPIPYGLVSPLRNLAADRVGRLLKGWAHLPHDERMRLLRCYLRLHGPRDDTNNLTLTWQ